MSDHHSLSLPDPPPVGREACTVPTGLEFGCQVPLVLPQPGAQAKIGLWFRLEREAGPLTQGIVIRAATLPAGGSLQLHPTDEHSCFMLETDSVSVFRCEAVPAEARYWTSLLDQLGPRSAHATNLVQVQGEPVAYPSIITALRNLVERTEALSRMSAAAACTTGSEPSSDGSPLPSRLLINPNRNRALTLFFYQADKYEVVRFGLRRIDRVVAAPTTEIETEIRAEIDQQLRQLDLIDLHGHLTSAARAQFSWQWSFVLPTPHVLVKTCLADRSITESSVFGAIKIDPRQRPGQAA